MPLHEYTPGFQFPRGFQPLNPIPVDSWSGPYANADGTTASAIQDALDNIPDNLRFLSMEVRILARTGPGGSTLAYKYWFRGNTGTLEEFSSGGGGGSTITNYVESFNGRTGAVQGVSAALPGDGIAVSAVTGSVTITNTGVTYISAGSFISVSGNTGTVTITNLGVHSFNGKTGAVTGASLGANTFSELNTFNAGISASGATLGRLVVNGGISASGGLTLGGGVWAPGGVTAGSLSQFGTLFVTGTINGSGLDVSGATLGTLRVSTGATVSGRLDVGGVLDVVGGVTLESTLDVVGAARFAAGLSAASVYASQGSTFGSTVQVNGGFSAGSTSTFGGLATFNGGLSAAGATFSTVTVNSGATVGGRLDVGGVLDVVSGATFESTIDVSGIARFVSGISAAGSTFQNLTVRPNGRLIVEPGGYIQVSGNILTNTIRSQNGASFDSGIDVSGSLGRFFNGLSANSGSFGTVSTTGQATLNSLSVTNNASVGGTLDVLGNLYVQGTLTTVNETQLLIQDKYLVLGSTLNTSSLADGAGVYVGATVGANAIAGICYSHSGNQWSSSHAFNIPTNASYRIGGVTAIAGTFLGSAIAGSSLTSVGTISIGVWQGTTIGLDYGGTNKNLSAIGVSGGIVFKDGTGLSVLSSAGTVGQYLSSGGANNVPTWASFSALTGLTADSVNITNTESINGTYFITFVDASANGTRTMRADSGITYNPSTNTISCTQIEAIVDGGTW